MTIKVEMCKHYSCQVMPNGFLKECKKLHYPSLKCHSERKDCKDYEPSESKMDENNG